MKSLSKERLSMLQGAVIMCTNEYGGHITYITKSQLIELRSRSCTRVCGVESGQDVPVSGVSVKMRTASSSCLKAIFTIIFILSVILALCSFLYESQQ